MNGLVLFELCLAALNGYCLHMNLKRTDDFGKMLCMMNGFAMLLCIMCACIWWK